MLLLSAVGSNRLLQQSRRLTTRIRIGGDGCSSAPRILRHVSTNTQLSSSSSDSPSSSLLYPQGRIQQTWLYGSCHHSSLYRINFSSSLATQPHTESWIRRRVATSTIAQRRSFSSTNNNGSGSDGSKKNENNTLSDSGSANKKKQETSPSSEQQTTGDDVRNRFTKIVHQVEDQIRQVEGTISWNTGDLVSVYGVILLILFIIFTPFIVRRMRKSGNTYEIDLDVDDPVSHVGSIFREEYLNQVHQENGENNTSSSSSSSSSLDFASGILKSQSLQSTLTDLITNILESERFQKACQKLLKTLWDDLVQDPETLQQIIHLLQHAVTSKPIMDAVTKLVLDILKDPQVNDELTKLVVSVGNESDVLNAVQELLTNSAHNALNDSDLLDHSMEFATDVVGDDVVQRTSGEALRNTVTHAVRPSLTAALTMFGVAFLWLGWSVWSHASSTSTSSSFSDDRALSTVLETISTRTVQVTGNILSFPGRFIGSILSTVWTILTSPFRMIHHASQSTLSYLSHRTEQVLFTLPNTIFKSTIKWIESISKSGMERIHRQLTNMGTFVATSIVGTSVSFVADTTQDMISFVSVPFYVTTLAIQNKMVDMSTYCVDMICTHVEKISNSVVTMISKSPTSIGQSMAQSSVIQFGERMQSIITTTLTKLSNGLFGGGDSNTKKL